MQCAFFFLQNSFMCENFSTFAMSFERQVIFSLTLKVVATLTIQQRFYEDTNY